MTFKSFSGSEVLAWEPEKTDEQDFTDFSD
jgi:hypothetical protein